MQQVVGRRQQQVRPSGQSQRQQGGPEGGLADNDIAMLRHAEFRGLKLGPRVLRTETAGIAALAALQAMFGDF